MWKIFPNDDALKGSIQTYPWSIQKRVIWKSLEVSFFLLFLTLFRMGLFRAAQGKRGPP